MGGMGTRSRPRQLWRFHRDRFLNLLPPPVGLTLDIGCGEGRFPRDLQAPGHRVAAIDASPTLIEHARRADPVGDYTVADAADLRTRTHRYNW